MATALHLMGLPNLATLEQTFNEIVCCHRNLCDRTRATRTGDRPSLCGSHRSSDTLKSEQH
ncbi:MAG TPA: hypothetical protein V6D11_28245 [Waterburya sp.]